MREQLDLCGPIGARSTVLDCDRPRGTNAAHWPAFIQCDKYVSMCSRVVLSDGLRGLHQCGEHGQLLHQSACGLHPHPGEQCQLLREERPVKVACATSHKVGIIVMMSLDCQELKDPPPFILELDH